MYCGPIPHHYQLADHSCRCTPVGAVGGRGGAGGGGGTVTELQSSRPGQLVLTGELRQTFCAYSPCPLTSAGGRGGVKAVPALNISQFLFLSKLQACH